MADTDYIPLLVTDETVTDIEASAGPVVVIFATDSKVSKVEASAEEGN